MISEDRGSERDMGVFTLPHLVGYGDDSLGGATWGQPTCANLNAGFAL